MNNIDTNSQRNQPEANLTYQTSEEIQHIVSKIPTKYGIRITLFIIILLLTLIGLAHFTTYPDTTVGQIVINTDDPPVKIISSVHGKLILTKKNHEDVNPGDLIAYIQNSGQIDDVQKIDSLLKSAATFIDNPLYLSKSISMFPYRVSLGELNSFYSDFINSLIEYSNYYTDDLYSKQEQTLKNLLSEQNYLLRSSEIKLNYALKQLQIGEKVFQRDSILFKQRITSAAEFDRSAQDFLSHKQSLEIYESQMHDIKQNILSTSNQLQQIKIQKTEKNIALKQQLLSTFNRLADQIKEWESTYTFRSSKEGNLQYFQFWNNNDFVRNDEPLFSIVSRKSKIVGQLLLPRLGIGKVKKGQEVTIKLDDYPFEEFGILIGLVSRISLITNTINTNEGEIENYLIEIELPKNLQTQSGQILNFKSELKGTAEIITEKKSLLKRMFEKVQSVNPQ